MNYRTAPIAFATVLLASANYSTLGGGTNILSSLQSRDEWELPRAGNSNSNLVGFIASFIMIRPTSFLDKRQGFEVDHCDAIWTKGLCMVATTSTYDLDPGQVPERVPYPEGAPTRPDRGGSTPQRAQKNHPVGRSVGRCGIFSAQRNEERDDSAIYIVSPDGKVLGTNTSTRVYKYTIGRREPINWFDLMLRTLGWGYGQYLRQIICETEAGLPAYLSVLEASGSCEAMPKGKWLLTCDKRLDNLVRSASFTPQDAVEPLFVASNAGLVECPELRLAASGSLDYTLLHLHFQLLTLTNVSASSTVFTSRCAEVRQRMDAPLPKRTVVYDCRGPTVRIIHE